MWKNEVVVFLEDLGVICSLFSPNSYFASFEESRSLLGEPTLSKMSEVQN